ncbi:RAB3A interacting protein [Coemansia thaxteri]|nr:RAB3A interacting protein [Coemansia thaxteri]KAJ2470678.1 RAB3A interacting protein [Coemansia sp. RSA 2322]
MASKIQQQPHRRADTGSGDYERALRSPSATLAGADEMAAATMGAGLGEAAIKRQGIIIPGEYDEAVTVTSTRLATATLDAFPMPPGSAECGAGVVGGKGLARRASEEAAVSDCAPTFGRHRTAFKLASARYCAATAAGGVAPGSAEDNAVLRRTRSQSPPPPQTALGEKQQQQPCGLAGAAALLSPPLSAQMRANDAADRRADRHMSTLVLVPVAAPCAEGAVAAIGSAGDPAWRSQRGSGSSDATVAADAAAQYEALMLRAQEQRNAALAEAGAAQAQAQALGGEAARLRAALAAAGERLREEGARRAAAEAKCALMECELAELSSTIQLEAQALVAAERREHRADADRMARAHAEVLQLLAMERAQAAALKRSLEAASEALDRERADADRLRAGMAAFERQISGLIAIAGDAGGDRPPHPPRPEPHIAARLFFGNDATRSDTRLAEFLGFTNASSDREAQASAFMQRCMREDVAPTLAADAASAMPSLAAWSKGRRLVAGVQENTLVLESYAPRVALGRVLSLGCYLCGCAVNRPDHVPSELSPPPSLSEHRVLSSSSSSLSLSLGCSPGRAPRARCEMYRMRFSDHDDDNKPLCPHCHARMVAVCSFFAYLKIVRKGLIKRPIADIWLEVNRARLQMWLARSGASPDSSLSIAMG